MLTFAVSLLLPGICTNLMLDVHFAIRNDKYDCPSSTNTCIPTGDLMPGKPQYVCRDGRDDWTTCSSWSLPALSQPR